MLELQDIKYSCLRMNYSLYYLFYAWMVLYVDLVAHTPGKSASNHFVITCSYTNVRFEAFFYMFSARNKFISEVIFQSPHFLELDWLLKSKFLYWKTNFNYFWMSEPNQKQYSHFLTIPYRSSLPELLWKYAANFQENTNAEVWFQ